MVEKRLISQASTSYTGVFSSKEVDSVIKKSLKSRGFTLASQHHHIAHETENSPEPEKNQVIEYQFSKKVGEFDTHKMLVEFETHNIQPLTITDGEIEKLMEQGEITVSITARIHAKREGNIGYTKIRSFVHYVHQRLFATQEAENTQLKDDVKHIIDEIGLYLAEMDYEQE